MRKGCEYFLHHTGITLKVSEILFSDGLDS